MVNEKYKFVSENTTKFLSLHDCDCLRFFYQDGCLVFEMEWMEVLATHPLNPNNKAYQSGPGRIIFEEVELEECVLKESKPIDGKQIVHELNQIEGINFKDVEFLEYSEIEAANGFRAKMFMLFNNDTYYDNILLEFFFCKSFVMWDELTSTSWFEDDIWKK